MKDLSKFNSTKFWEKVNKTDNCWEWKAGKHKFGYGMFGTKNNQGYSHRISWEIHNGKIPDSLCVLHKCDNPSCVRPDHLFLGTKNQNSKDMVRKNRQCFGESVKVSKLKSIDVLCIRALYYWSKFSRKDIAIEYNITKENVCSIVNGKTWNSVRLEF